MLNANQYKTPIRGEIRMNNKEQFILSMWYLFQDKIENDVYYLLFEYKNVRFRLYYNSRYSHIKFYAYTSFGWSISDSIYDYANKEYVEDLGKFLSDKFQCPVSLEWFNRSNKGRMRFNAGQVWSSPDKLPRTILPKEEDGYIYRDRIPANFNGFIPYEFAKKETKSNEQETMKIAC